MSEDIQTGQTKAESPTKSFYSNLQTAYDYFNTKLFDGKLSPCLITLRSNNRIYGYHHTDRFINQQGKLISELGLHPAFFTMRPVEFGLSTLVHEMVHHWQAQFGNETKSNPHNAQWGNKMEEVGLMPSDSGLPGGKKTGRHVTHYIIPNGPFDHACKVFVRDGFEFQWYDRYSPREAREADYSTEPLAQAGVKIEVSEPPIDTLPEPIEQTRVVLPGVQEMPVLTQPSVFGPPPKRPNSRLKQVCPCCEVTVWTAKDVKLVCGNCNVPFDVQKVEVNGVFDL